MRRLERALLSIAFAVLTVLVFSANVCAQGPVPTPEHPPMAAQQFDRDKETLYATFSQNRKSLGPEHRQRAYRAAKELVQRYGGDNDSYAKEARKFVTEVEREVNQFEVVNAYTAKSYIKAFELARPVLKTDPDNFFLLGILAESGYENALAKDPKLNDETIDYLRRALKRLEAGKVTKPEPFKDLDAANGFLNMALGWFLKDKAPVDAAVALEKAIRPKSPYENDPLTYYRLGVTTLKGEFAQLSAEYNKKFGTKPPSPAQQAMLKRINLIGARAIDAYARSVALSDSKRAGSSVSPEFRNLVMEQLTALYKSFFNNSDAGLDEYIEQVLSKPRP